MEMLTPEPSIILLQILDTGVNFGEIVWVKRVLIQKSSFAEGAFCRLVFPATGQQV